MKLAAFELITSLKIPPAVGSNRQDAAAAKPYNETKHQKADGQLVGVLHCTDELARRILQILQAANTAATANPAPLASKAPGAIAIVVEQTNA
jgi:hypothetical protein